MSKLKISHIINPVKVGENSDLFAAQPITFETMRRAKDFVREEVEVNLLTTQYAEDREIIPETFTITPDLEQSILDHGTFVKQRKLPFIGDIITRAIEFDPTADYIIYTNTDIGLMPHFYSFVHRRIQEGFDAFVINRRTISKDYTLESLGRAYCEYGKKHPGFDCFVFKLKAACIYQLEKVCIGTTRIGLALISNLIMHSVKFRIFTEEHATFHLGEDQVWQNPELSDYVAHNEKEAMKVLKKLRAVNPEKFDSDAVIQKYYKALLKLKSEGNSEIKTEKKTTFYQRIFNKK
ncbi:MAG: hypothetical protein AAFP76_13765 [Bacteroidota bacterium]